MMCATREKLIEKKKLLFTYRADFVLVSKQVVDINEMLSRITCHLGFINLSGRIRFHYCDKWETEAVWKD